MVPLLLAVSLFLPGSRPLALHPLLMLQGTAQPAPLVLPPRLASSNLSPSAVDGPMSRTARLVLWHPDPCPLLRHLATQPRPLILCRPRLLVLTSPCSHRLSRQHLSPHSVAQCPFQHGFRCCAASVRSCLLVCRHFRVLPHVSRPLTQNQVLLRLTLRHLVTHHGMRFNGIGSATGCGLLKPLPWPVSL